MSLHWKENGRFLLAETPSQFAERLGVNLRSVYRMVDRGLPARRVGGSFFVLVEEGIEWLLQQPKCQIPRLNLVNALYQDRKIQGAG